MKQRNLTLGFALIAMAVARTGGAQTIAPSKPSDSAFMKNAAAAGMAEVDAAQMAIDKASRPDLKSYAQMLMDDHSKANEELKALAARENVTLPTGPTAAQRATKDRLSHLSGPAFDSAYIDAMVKDHAAAVMLFTHEANSGADADAKAWAAKILPVLTAHKTKADKLAADVRAKPAK